MLHEIKNQINDATIEAEMLQNYANHLEQAAKSDDTNYKMLVLDENMKMWITIETATQKPDNYMPENIKSNLGKLSKYVEQVTISKGVDMNETYFKSLANINRQIAEGLIESVNYSLAQQEAYYLAKCGLDLAQAVKDNNQQKLVEALDNNQKLWLMIKTLMSKGRSALADETKNNMIKLADYVAKNTVKIGQNLDNPDTKMLDSFVSINRHISEGLLGHR